MVFVWDPVKDEANWRKHGVRFADAVSVFDDPNCTFEIDRMVDHELRWHATGMSQAGPVLLVVHTIQGDTEEKIRVISAREATAHEKRSYKLGAL